MSYTEVTKPSFPSTVWDESANFWDEEDLAWDGSGYADLDKPFITNYDGVAFFDEANAPFLDPLPFSLLGSYEPSAPTYTEITKPS